MLRLLLTAIAIFSAVAYASAEKRIALVIGNDDYRELPRLERAVGDARAIKASLERLGFRVTLAENVGFAEFATTIASFGATIEPGDEVVLHYSGHGVAINGRNYLIPVDMPKPGQPSLVTRLAPDAGALVSELSDHRAKLVFAILDACRDNPFTGTGRSIGASRGLSRMEPQAGEFILFSAGPGEQALDRLGDDDVAATSVFTRVLLEHLETPGLSLQDLAKATQSEVRKLAATVDAVQFPDYFDRTEGKPVLMPASAEPMPSASVGASAPSNSDNAEVIFWQSVDATSRGDLSAYLERFPDGIFAPLARARLAALTPAAPPQPEAPGPSQPRNEASGPQPLGLEAHHSAAALPRDDEAPKRLGTPSSAPVDNPPPDKDGPLQIGLAASAQQDEALASAPESARAPDFPLPHAPGESCSTRLTGIGIDTYCVSSVLPPQLGNRYGTGNLYDGAASTAWVPKNLPTSIGQWISVQFNEPRTIRAILIDNGYQKSADIFRKNSRVRRLQANFSDGTTMDFDLADRRGTQTLTLGPALKAQWVQVVIADVYRGSKYQDTAISRLLVDSMAIK